MTENKEIITDYWFLRDAGYTVGGSILALFLVYNRKDINNALYTAKL